MVPEIVPELGRLWAGYPRVEADLFQGAPRDTVHKGLRQLPHVVTGPVVGLVGPPGCLREVEEVLAVDQAALDLVEGIGLQEAASVFLDMVRERDEAEGKGRVHSN